MDGASVQHTVAFADGPGGGNPCPVVFGAGAWDDTQRRAAAAAFGHETCFVLDPPPGGGGAAVALRYFVPNHEMEMCVHATVAAAVLLGLAGTYRGKAETAVRPAKLRTELADGLRWLRGHPLLRRLVVVAGLLSLVSELAQAQLVLYALQDLHLSDATFGLFAFVGGIGGLAGAGAAPRLVRATGRRAVVVGGIVCCGAGFGGMGLVRSPVAGAALFGLFAAAVVAVNVVLATARHTLVPGELLGRVIGVWRTAVWGAIPLGALLGGVLTEALGTAARTFAVSGAAMLVIAAFAFGALRRFPLAPVTNRTQPRR